MPLVAVAALSACSSQPTAVAFTKADVGSITMVIEELETVFNAKDPVKAAALFAGDAVVMPPNASTMRGKDAVRQYYEGRFAGGATDLTLDPKDISGSGTLAYASGDYRLRMVPPGGGAERPDRGKFVWVFRRLDGRWLIEYVIFSSDFAPPGT
jgi:uncharacterized protein (TIGR02246 family)